MSIIAVVSAGASEYFHLRRWLNHSPRCKAPFSVSNLCSIKKTNQQLEGHV